MAKTKISERREMYARRRAYSATQPDEPPVMERSERVALEAARVKAAAGPAANKAAAGPAENKAAEPDATDGAIAEAGESGIDLSTVTGTGAGGRITKADVARAAK